LEAADEPSAASPQLVLIVWGRLVTCGGLVIRLV